MIIARSSIIARQPKGMDPYQAYLNMGPAAMVEARNQRNLAKHHRGVNVGAVVLGISEDGVIGIASGANQNLRPGKNDTKVCAEQVAVQKLMDKGVYRLIGLWVSGPPQPDTQSGYIGPTLSTCGECRDVLSGAEHLEGYDDALFTSVHPTRDEYEVYTGREQTALHAAPNNVVAINHYRDRGFRNWERAARSYAAYLQHPENYPQLTGSYAARLAIGGLLEPQAA